MPDLRCYFVTGKGTPAEIVRIAAAAARGGAGVVQVRSKPISARDLYHLGREVARAVAQANPETRVLIDDRVDVAAALRHAGEPVRSGVKWLATRWIRARPFDVWTGPEAA